MNTFLIIGFVLVSFVAADLPTFLATNGSSTWFGNGNRVPVAAHGNTLLTFGTHVLNSDNYLLVLRKETDNYVEIASVLTNDLYCFNVFTNGKWFGASLQSGLLLFQLDANNQVVNQTFNEEVVTYTIALLSDNTIVYITSNAQEFSTLLFNEGNATWTPGNTLPVPNVVLSNWPLTTVWFTDEFIVCYNSSYHGLIYARQAVDEWTLADVVTLYQGEASLDYFRLAFNGKDALVVSKSIANSGNSTLTFFTKIDGVWISQDAVLASNEQLEQAATIEQDRFVFTYPSEMTGYNSKRGGGPANQPQGKAVVYQRRFDNVWVPTMAIISMENAFLARTLAVTDDDIAFFTSSGETSQINNFFTLSSCTTSAVSLACANPQKTRDCSELKDKTETLTDCDSLTIGVAFNSSSFQSGEVSVVSATFNFTSPIMQAPAECQVSYTCESAPVVVNSPTASPVRPASSATKQFGLSMMALIGGIALI